MQASVSFPIPEDTCLVAVAKNNISGYAEIELSGKIPLRDFSIFMWVKTRMHKYEGNMSLFSYTVNNYSVLSLAHHGKSAISHKSRIDLFDSGM